MKQPTFGMINQRAKLLHINLRKEGEEENRVPACDLKFEVTTDASLLGYFSDTLRNMLYLPDGSVRYLFMGPVSWGAEIRNLILDIRVPWQSLPIEMRQVKLKKFLFEPQANWAMKMTFSAQAHMAYAEGIADTLHRALLDDVRLDISTDGDLFRDVAKSVKEAHETAKADGVSVTVPTVGPGEPAAVTFGALTNGILQNLRQMGMEEAKKDAADFDRGLATALKNYGAEFVDEHYAELSSAFPEARRKLANARGSSRSYDSMNDWITAFGGMLILSATRSIFTCDAACSAWSRWHQMIR